MLASPGPAFPKIRRAPQQKSSFTCRVMQVLHALKFRELTFPGRCYVHYNIVRELTFSVT
jgi:hypothetical protein